MLVFIIPDARRQKKKPDTRMSDFFFGTTEQDLLKLFEWLISTVDQPIIKLPEVGNNKEKIIY